MNNVPTEEEEQAWQELEHKQRAQIEAAKFISEYHNELGIMTIRKAFELGFRRGYTQGENK